jgi:ABC transporter with metal-binding/Fe-S-binding domain ATP-binding protein
MFHFPNLKWTGLQAEAIGVPQLTRQTAGIKEEELEDLKQALSEATKKFELEGIYTGAIASVYQKSRVDRICKELRLECVSPLWGVDPEVHLRGLVKDKFVVMVDSVSALGLDRSWLGRTLDDTAITELVALGKKFKFNVGLEGGEGETFVLDCPLFKERVEVQESKVHWRGDSGYLQIDKAQLIQKF